jgi:hypothetical protein
VWAQSTGLYANRYDVISGWETPQKIGDTSTGWSDLHLAVSRSGHAIVAWLLSDQRFSHLQVVRYTPGVGWGTVETLLGIGEPKDTAIDDSGNAFIVAERLIITMYGEIRQLIIARFDQERGWRYSSINDTETSTNSSRFPKISVDGSGNGFVMWFEGDSSANKVYVSRCTKTVLGSPEQIASLTGISGPCTNLVVDKNGNAMALWNQQDSTSTSHTYACRYNVASGWGAAERIDDSSADSIDQFLSVDPDGNFHAIWTQITGSSSSDIYSSRFTPSTGWQPPSFVGSGGGTIARFPRIAADESGNVFAAWLQYDPNAPTGRFGGDGKVFANRCRSGSNWGTQQLLSTALGDAVNPELAVYQPGRAMVIWAQSTGYVEGSSELEYGIFSSRFE